MNNKTASTYSPTAFDRTWTVICNYAIGLGGIAMAIFLLALGLAAINFIVETISGYGVTHYETFLDAFMVLAVGIALGGSSYLVVDIFEDGHKAVYGWPLVVFLAMALVGQLTNSFSLYDLTYQVCAAMVGLGFALKGQQRIG